MKHALENIRILDLSRVLAGPCCTQILGDLGADIIKVERPNQGDDTRKWGPPFLKDSNGDDTEESAYYLSANRNKRSIAVDFTTADGQELIHKLLEKSDVLIENFKVGNLAKYGLSYEQIKTRHPHIIYCSITGFGQNGVLSSEPGYDFLAQAMGGLMAITGEKEGGPMKVGVALSDVMTGHYAAIGILAALQSRTHTNKGQHIDLSLLDCTLAGMTNIAQYYLTSGNLAKRQGNAHSTIVPYQAFATKDGHIIIAVGNDRQFTRLCDFIGKSEWAQDVRFATNQKRVANRETLIPAIEAIIAQKDSATWLAGLRDVDVPCGPVNDMAQAFDEPQVQERAMKINMTHSATGENIDLVGSPLKLSETPVTYRHAPPTNGEHTDMLLKELLGMDENNIDNLRKKDVIA